MVPFESSGAVSYSSSIVTMGLSCIILEIKRYIGRIRPCFRRPRQGWGLPSQCLNVSYGKKLEWLGYPMVTNLKIRLFVSTECTNVTDRQTDGRADRHCMTTQAALMHRIARQKGSSFFLTHSVVIDNGYDTFSSLRWLSILLGGIVYIVDNMCVACSQVSSQFVEHFRLVSVSGHQQGCQGALLCYQRHEITLLRLRT